MTELILGTAQLGMSYGIANKTGKPDQNLAREMIRAAWERGVRSFDTAPEYGTSEDVLGMAIKDLSLTQEARVMTKIDELPNAELDTIITSVESSLNRLHIPQLELLSIRRKPFFAFWEEGLREVIEVILEKGMAKRVGVSVYEPDEALRALEKSGIDAVQIPANIVDRRFEEAGVFQKADELGKKIYVRSIFLQGLLLMRPSDLSPGMSFAATFLERLDALGKIWDMSRPAMCLGALIDRYRNASILFGAETREQIENTLDAAQVTLPEGLLTDLREMCRGVDDRVRNPMVWPK